MAENPMVNYNQINKETASNHFNVRDEYKTNTYEQKDRKSTRLNSSHMSESRMPSSA